VASDGPAGEYRIVFTRSARKELEALPRTVASRVLSRVEALASAPRPAGSRKLVGTENLWRIRVGSYRVLYAIDDRQLLVDIIAIRHRSDAYR
jgi:mRNA interferase RelE/StbE